MEICKKIIFTSGSPPQTSKKFGGGLYSLEINKNSFKIQKTLSGNCYGTLKKDKNFLIIDEHKGILEYNNRKIKKIKSLKKGLRPHGLTYSKTQSKYYLCCTELDSVLVLNENFDYTK